MDKLKLTRADFWIRLTGYVWLYLGWFGCMMAVLGVVLQLVGGPVIDRITGQPKSVLAGAAFMIAISSAFILLGRWIVRNYQKGRRSGF